MLMMSIIYISFSNFMHLSSDNYVDVDACRMSNYGSTKCRNYDGTCDGGRILDQVLIQCS